MIYYSLYMVLVIILLDVQLKINQIQQEMNLECCISD